MEDAADGKGRIRVACYSGYKAEECPRSFLLGGDKKTVERVIDAWAGEDHLYFKLLADDRKVYLIRYDRWKDFWTLEKVLNPLGEH